MLALGRERRSVLRSGNGARHFSSCHRIFHHRIAVYFGNCSNFLRRTLSRIVGIQRRGIIPETIRCQAQRHIVDSGIVMEMLVAVSHNRQA